MKTLIAIGTGVVVTGLGMMAINSFPKSRAIVAGGFPALFAMLKS